MERNDTGTRFAVKLNLNLENNAFKQTSLFLIDIKYGSKLQPRTKLQIFLPK
jgi:hypothetical protein